MLDPVPEEAFDRITRIAKRVLDVPVALVSLLDADRQVYKSCLGLPERVEVEREDPLSHSYCKHVVASGGPLVAEDAREHPLLRESPAIEELEAIAYLGVPLVTEDGHVLGTHCVIDREPRAWTPAELELVRDLADAASAEIDLRRSRARLRQLRDELEEEVRERSAELAASEAKFRGLFVESPVGIALVSPEGRPLEVNRALADMLGYEPDELRAMTFPEFTHPDDVEKDVERYEKLLAGEIDDYQIEKRYVTGSGGVVWADLRVSAFRRDDDGPPHIVAFARDVSARRRLEAELREREQRYETLLTEISDVVTVLDEDGTVVYQSPSIEEVFGWDRDELLGRPVVELVHPDDVDDVREALVRGVTEGGQRTVQYRFRHADGSWRLVESTGAVPDVETLDRVMVTRDVTDRVEAQQMYRAVFGTTPSAVGVATLEDGRFVDINRGFQDLLGHDREDAVGSTADELGVWADPAERDRVVEAVRERGAVHDREVEFRTSDGETLDVLFSGSVLELGGRRYLVGAARDVTERKAMEEHLRYQALHDPLTGLANRTLLSDRVKQGLARARRHQESLGLLMLDIHRFSRINDRLGHTAGDRVLVEVARRLRAAVREEDTVARWGGDEFVVVMPDAGTPAMVDVEERIRDAVRAPIEAAGESLRVDLTIGAVVHSAAGHRRAVQTDDPEELIRFGELALHGAKEQSAAGFSLFDPEAEVEGAGQIRLEAELRNALESGRIVPHYQPVVRLDDGSVVGFEALARWRRPQGERVPPSAFIPLAEEVGLIGVLGEAVFREGCRQVAGWPADGASGATLRVSFNLSGQQFDDPGLAERLDRWREGAGLPTDQVILEVTETSLMRIPARVHELRDLGYRIYVDDFGTGYSTFTYLRDLELDGLKIDMTFVRDIADRAADAALVETMVTLGRRLGLAVVAEGIETEEQRRLLRDLGCELGQGFLFSKARPAGEIAELLGSSGG